MNAEGDDGGSDLAARSFLIHFNARRCLWPSFVVVHRLPVVEMFLAGHREGLCVSGTGKCAVGAVWQVADDAKTVACF
jgi:hypothetical protein